ncbi:MAG: 3-isopropylmalate dehydratase small subunit [Gammaproteobacteria bacterium]|nr:3-isopropylmalate dehydratase small subunit [Gammaproteobacteria bacterium]TVQ48802.1 MAG: 3-isopropylmalate dehydratase small subunit [Gammaproteobacteria bacterium]
MEPIKVIRSRTVVLPYDDVDTDQIIPARYLTTTTRDGLGEAAFADWRYDENGEPRPDFELNQPEAAGCQVLVAGNNFGCGSSREHAPWALLDSGILAVISTEIADIFRSNSLKNGLLPVVVDADTHAWLLANPGAEVSIDLAERLVGLPDGRQVAFPIDGFSRYCLMNGIDQLGFLLQQEAEILKFEQNRPWQP